MVRSVIPLDEWRTVVTDQVPRRRPPTACQCDRTDEHERHEWADHRNQFMCHGVDL